MKFLLKFLFVFAGVSIAHAQVYEQGGTFTSPVDQELTIRYLGVLPVKDNLEGIYARPLEEKLTELLKNHHRWNYRPLTMAGPMPDMLELEQKPETVIGLSAGSEADALVATQLSKGPRGISLRMNLFLRKTGRLIAQAQLNDHARFDLPDVQMQTAALLEKLLEKIPYQGHVLSRTGNRVTVNLGKRDGLAEGQTLSAVQIIGVDRHPKFQFIVQSHKEVLGTIKILKVEDTLSFGSVAYERERGSIRKNTKLSGLEKVAYTVPDRLESEAENQRPEREKLGNPLIFGQNAGEWKPINPPTFGQVGVRIGGGSYNGKTSLSSSGSLEASTSLYPQIALDGELWINPEWTARFKWEQGIASTDNPLGGDPSSLSHSLSAFALMIGYNFLLQQEYFGPKIEVSAGFSSYGASVDDSEPTGLTSMKYSGLTLGLRGNMPVTDDKKWRAGLGLNIVFKPSLKETPVTSGDESSNAVNDFNFTVSHQLKVNLLIVGDLNFRLYRATFTGAGTRDGGETASDASQKLTTLSGGIVYMF